MREGEGFCSHGTEQSPNPEGHCEAEAGRDTRSRTPEIRTISKGSNVQPDRRNKDYVTMSRSMSKDTTGSKAGERH